MMMLRRAFIRCGCNSGIRRFAHTSRDFNEDILGGNIEDDNSAPVIFDRNAKRMQRNRAAQHQRAREYDHLKDNIAAKLADRLNDIKGHSYHSVLDLGCGSGHLLKHIANRDDVKSVIMCDYSEQMLMRDVELDKNYKVKPIRMVVDEEFLPFASEQFDLIISNLSMHWVNDLPGYFKQIKRCLKPDGVFLGSTFGENTLSELRNALYLAETEREGGFGIHTSAFTRVSSIGNLISGARLALPTIDTEEIKVVYSDMFALMDDLRGMAESNALVTRPDSISRTSVAAAAAIYHQLYASRELGGIPATFQIIYMIGWGPHPSQPKPLARGSAKMHLSQMENMKGLSFGTEDTPQPINKPSQQTGTSIEDLFKVNPQSTTCQPTNSDQSTTSSQSTTNNQPTNEDKTEYNSEDFVISRIDSSGNFYKGTNKR